MVDSNTIGQPQILLVEDDPALNMVVAMDLSAAGYLVHSAANGQQALDILNKFQIDLLVLDILLPDTSAYQVVANLRKNDRYSRLPLLLHTSMDLIAEERAQLTLGPTLFVTKSLASAETMLVAVKKLLGNRNEPAANHDSA
jgi:DNA-binding response OmpR family regulator